MTRPLVLIAAACAAVVGFPQLSAESPKPQSTELQWRKSDTAVALLHGQNVLWQFNFGPELNVPFFHPVGTPGGQVMTWDRPDDHAWHHGLWFCWKYINDVNYWEHNGKTGKPAGHTVWSDVKVDTRDDHSANVTMTLRYSPRGEDKAVLVERRSIDISAPDAEGAFHFDWRADFKAGEGAVELDRTPPKEQSWGGYAGLSVRFAKDLTDRQAISVEGPVEFGAGNRYRGRGTAMEYEGRIGDKPVGLAFLDSAQNPRHPTPWYVIASPVMSYINSALLHDEPLNLKAGEKMTLEYRLVIHPGTWSAARLKAALKEYRQSASH